MAAPELGVFSMLTGEGEQVHVCARMLEAEGWGREIQSTRNYLCIKKLKENISRAIEAHLLNNDDSSSFSTTIEGT